MITQIKHIKNKVTTLLREKPELRDNDNKLIANIWNCEIGRENDEKKTHKSHSTTAYCFLQAFAAGQHTNPESIRRIRQKIQEQNPELRGKSYVNRKKHEKVVRKEIMTA